MAALFPAPRTTHDYTADDRAILEAEAREAAASKTSVDDFTFGGGVVGTSAEEIERDHSFREIPPGDHLLVVTGFLKDPKLERKEAYVSGKRVSYSTYSVVVKFALASDPGAQVTDYFLLTPNDPAGLAAFVEGTSKADGRMKGFMASKLFHFLERLGFPIVKGQRLPDSALRLGNWRGRQVYATIEPGKPYFDAASGTERPGRNQIKPFSYRPASSPSAVGLASASPQSPRHAAPLSNGLESI